MVLVDGCDPSDVDRLVRFSCRVGDDSQFHTGSVNACSDGYHDAVRKSSATKLGVDIDDVKCSFEEVDLEPVQEPESDGIVTKMRMARDCGPNFNLRNIMHHNYFSCRYVGEATLPDGSVIRDRRREYKGMLPSCGVGPQASRDLLKDVREYVHHAVHGDSLGLNKRNFDCTIMGVPPH